MQTSARNAISCTMQVNITTLQTTDPADKLWKRQLAAFVDLLPKYCQDAVTEHHITNTALKNATCLLVGRVRGADSKKRNAESMGGFLIANESEYPGYFFIDVVCADTAAPGLGKAMVLHAEKIAKDKHKTGVVLSSLPHVVGYYKSMGYKYRELCNDKEDAFLAKQSGKLTRPLIEKHKRMSPTPAQWKSHIASDTKEGKAYTKFLTLLMNKKLVKTKECGSVAECNVDGYIMTKCFADTVDSNNFTDEKPTTRASTRLSQRLVQRPVPSRSTHPVNSTAETKSSASTKKPGATRNRSKVVKEQSSATKKPSRATKKKSSATKNQSMVVKEQSSATKKPSSATKKKSSATRNQRS